MQKRKPDPQKPGKPKKKRSRRIIKAAVITLAVLAGLFFIAPYILLGQPTLGYAKVDRTLPKGFDTQAYQSGFAADGLYLVQRIEEIHPIFVIDDVLPDNYETVRSEFLDYVQKDITKADFVWAAQKFITTLRDGHMGGGYALHEIAEHVDAETRRAITTDIYVLLENLVAGNLPPVVLSDLLDVSFAAENGLLFLSDENGVPGAEVIAIGGVPTPKVLVAVETYYVFENEIDRGFIHSLFSRYWALLEKAGAKMTDGEVVLTLSDKGQEKQISATINISADEALGDGPAPDYIIRHETIEDVFYIDLRVFLDGDHITETAEAIESAVADGTRKFVIDLRGNTGGNEEAGYRLLQAMGIKEPDGSGGVMRINEYTDSLVGSWHNRYYGLFGVDYLYFEPGKASTENPNNVYISVLTDSDTYSSAANMALWIQDGKLGNIIGSPSRNAPNAFMNLIPVTLPNSGIIVLVSSNQTLRPDQSADLITARPDINVDPAGALDAALEHLRQL